MKWIFASFGIAALSACATDSAAEQPPEKTAPHGDEEEDGKAYAPGEHHGAHHSFEDADKWAKRFEDPSRDAWQKPEQVLDWMALAPGETVADIGAATGYFPVRIAKRVPEGKVYGVDIEQTMVDYLNKRAADEGISNLVAVLGEPADPKIPELVDVVLVVNTYHHIEDRSAYFQRLQAQTTAKARLVIVDFKKGDLGMGPPDAMKLAPEVVEQELVAAGWKPSAAYELDKQYVLVFERADQP